MGERASPPLPPGLPPPEGEMPQVLVRLDCQVEGEPCSDGHPSYECAQGEVSATHAGTSIAAASRNRNRR